jgi:hypothetical protein
MPGGSPVHSCLVQVAVLQCTLYTVPIHRHTSMSSTMRPRYIFNRSVPGQVFLLQFFPKWFGGTCFLCCLALSLKWFRRSSIVLPYIHLLTWQTLPEVIWVVVRCCNSSSSSSIASYCQPARHCKHNSEVVSQLDIASKIKSIQSVQSVVQSMSARRSRY